MTALRPALLLLFVCYCRASGGECDSDVDPKVRKFLALANFVAHFEHVYVVLLCFLSGLSCAHSTS